MSMNSILFISNMCVASRALYYDIYNEAFKYVVW